MWHLGAPGGHPLNYHFSGLHGHYPIYITGHEFPQHHFCLQSLVKLPALQTKIPGRQILAHPQKKGRAGQGLMTTITASRAYHAWLRRAPHTARGGWGQLSLSGCALLNCYLSCLNVGGLIKDFFGPLIQAFSSSFCCSKSSGMNLRRNTEHQLTGSCP